MEIIYVFDPLCGWCYGFGDVITRLEEKYGDYFTFNVVSGGMVLPDSAPPLSEMREYLQNAIPHLEQTTGVKIGQPYFQNLLLKEGVVLHSETPTLVFEALKPYASGVLLAKEIQDLMFVHGLHLNQYDSYRSLFEKYVPATDWAQGIGSFVETPENTQKTWEGFKQVKSWGVRGFPALLLRVNDEVFTMANGYAPYNRLSVVFDEVLQQVKSKD